MKEVVFRFGDNNRGFGMTTLPDTLDDAPVIVIFNAGVIHREGPYRLNVRVARKLAESGFIAVRVDLSGKGDTPARTGISNRESVASDWRSIKAAINASYGNRHLILMGLCSGADNAIKITAEDRDVRGLILLDPVAYADAGFKSRQLKAKLANIHKWLNLPKNVFKRIKRLIGLGVNHSTAAIGGLRDEPDIKDYQNCFTHLANTKGRVLAIFTSHGAEKYNQEGQFARALNINGLSECCEEVFWPQVEHLFPVQVHRERLIEKIHSWSIDNSQALSHKV